MSYVAHLVRRFFGSLSPRPPGDRDVAWALAHLLPGEAELWRQMPAADRRHSIEVARRFAALAQTDDRAQVAGALLHDVGKGASGLGTLRRVVATLLGPRTDRFRAYHDHERIGAGMLRAVGSDAATIALLDGTSSLSAALRAADGI